MPKTNEYWSADRRRRLCGDELWSGLACSTELCESSFHNITWICPCRAFHCGRDVINRQWSRVIMHHVKEFVLHRQEYKQRGLCKVVTRFSLSSVVRCCSGICMRSACTKWQKLKNEAMPSHLVRVMLIATSIFKIPSLRSCHNILSQTNHHYFTITHPLQVENTWIIFVSQYREQGGKLTLAASQHFIKSLLRETFGRKLTPHTQMCSRHFPVKPPLYCNNRCFVCVLMWLASH